MTKRKEQEALFHGDVDDFRVEIVEEGGLLAAAIAAVFPNAEHVSEKVNDLRRVVLNYDLEGKWVTSRVSGAEYVTTRKIRSVSIFPYLFKM
jgi:hypothetical protein